MVALSWDYFSAGPGLVYSPAVTYQKLYFNLQVVKAHIFDCKNISYHNFVKSCVGIVDYCVGFGSGGRVY